MLQKLYSIGIIPARYASTRFPGKPLVEIHGKTMVQRVYEQVIQANLDEVIVATDDQRIYDHVLSFGGRVEMTSTDHPTGTDRCIELAKRYDTNAILINIQGDEPFINPIQINELLQVFHENTEINIATQCKQIENNALIFDPNAIKVVRDQNNFALYFSRSPLPYLRNVPTEEWSLQNKHFKHIGIYAFRNETLAKLSSLPMGILETAESLEQLRWMEHGFKIYVAETQYETFGIDVPEDLKRIVL